MTLTPSTASTSKPRLRPYRLSDGKGLHLEVSPNGKKYWRFKYRFKSRSSTVSCGVFPAVSLEEARARRDTFRTLLADGIDPGEHVKMEKASRRADEARQIVATRIMLDNDGALSFRFGNRCVTLSPAETTELRTFLDATRAVTPKETTCP